MALGLLWAPFLACLVLAGIHVYLGLHVLARGVIFVDLALAQAAALGMTAALLAGHPRESTAAYVYALLFTAVGAALFALASACSGTVLRQLDTSNSAMPASENVSAMPDCDATAESVASILSKTGPFSISPSKRKSNKYSASVVGSSTLN